MAGLFVSSLALNVLANSVSLVLIEENQLTNQKTIKHINQIENVVVASNQLNGLTFQLQVGLNESQNIWQLDLASANQQLLSEGQYPQAGKYTLVDGNSLHFSRNGLGCDQLAGEYNILKANYNPETQQLEQFIGVFEQQCNNTLLRGKLVYTADSVESITEKEVNTLYATTDSHGTGAETNPASLTYALKQDGLFKQLIIGADESGSINIKDDLHWSGILELFAPAIIISGEYSEIESNVSSAVTLSAGLLEPLIVPNSGDINLSGNISTTGGSLMFHNDEVLTIYVTDDVAISEDLQAETIEIINIDAAEFSGGLQNNVSENLEITANNISLENNRISSGSDLIIINPEMLSLESTVKNEINISADTRRALIEGEDTINF